MDIVCSGWSESSHLIQLLKARDEKEKLPFENLIYTIDEYASELESTLILVDSLKSSMKRGRFSLGGRGDDLPTDSKSLTVYEAKLKELKEERTELYRQQGIQATHLLSLNDQLRSKDTTITALNVEIAALKASQQQNEDEIRKLSEKVKEGEAGAKIIGDELVALQLELLRLDQWQNEKDKLATRQEFDRNSPKIDDESSTVILDNKLKIIKEKEIVAPHQYPLSSSASRPSTRQLLTGSEDQKIILYDLTRISTKLVLKWAQMNGPIVALAIDEEGGKTVASCSAYDKEVTIWNLINGKIQCTLQFTDDNNNVAPILQFGPQFRLWMGLGRSVRLWDVQRGLLLRSWNRDVIPFDLERIQIDQKRPDRLWCFDAKGSFTILNGITGKLEVPWHPINSQITTAHSILYACSPERIVVAQRHRNADSDADANTDTDTDVDDWIITGYSRNTIELGGVFEFSLKNDLLKKRGNLKGISIHPDYCDLLALNLESNEILLLKVSKDHWTPSTLLLPEMSIDAIHWGPCEKDPITCENGCKLVTIEKETKILRLYTVSLLGNEG